MFHQMRVLSGRKRSPLGQGGRATACRSGGQRGGVRIRSDCGARHGLRRISAAPSSAEIGASPALVVGRADGCSQRGCSTTAPFPGGRNCRAGASRQDMNGARRSRSSPRARAASGLSSERPERLPCRGVLVT